MTQITCDAILFDLDGVLIDSTSCITRHWENWTRIHGLDLEEVMRVAYGLRPVETMRLVAPHLDADAETARFTAREVVDTDGVVAIDGALSLLKGIPKGLWGIVTSGSQAPARARLMRAGLPIPQTLVSGDDVTNGKPAPDPYLLGAERLGKAPENCVVLEDSPAGIAAANAAGMQVIGITTTHAKEKLPCEVIVDTLSALHILEGDGASKRLVVQIER